MKYIDIAKISHDIPTRMKYVQDFINFDPEKDGALIRSCQPLFTSSVLKDLDGRMLDQMLSFDTTSLPFTVPGQTGRQGCTVEELHLGHPNIKYLRFLQKLLAAMVSNDNWTPESPYWIYMDTVGRMHIGVTDTGLPSRKNRPPLKVHVREIALLIAWIDEAVTDVVMNSEEMDIKTKIATVKAFNKYWWMQNDLFTKHQTLVSLDQVGKSSLVTARGVRDMLLVTVTGAAIAVAGYSLMLLK